MNKLSLVLMADETRRGHLADLIKAHQNELIDSILVATADIRKLLSSITSLPFFMLPDEPDQGHQTILNLIVNRNVSAVIYLRDPSRANPSEPYIMTMINKCDEDDIALATNMSTAEAILHLLAEHPEALSGHHIAAQYLEDISSIHDQV